MTPVIFGTSCLGNLYKEVDFETKVAVAAEWFKAFDHPIIDSAGKHGAGLSLECIGKALARLGAKDWRVIRELWNRGIHFDWAMFACAPTLLVHPRELLDFVKILKDAGVTLIDSTVFNGGFLTGGDMIDYRKADPERDAAAFEFRDKYLALCRERGLDPAAPAVEYAFRLGFDAVALNTSSPRRILQNAAYATARAGEEFWKILSLPAQ